LWGAANFGQTVYYASTAGKHGNEITITEYVKKQGKKYQKLYEDRHYHCLIPLPPCGEYLLGNDKKTIFITLFLFLNRFNKTSAQA